MKFNLKNKVFVLSMLGLFALALLPMASAYTETACAGDCVETGWEATATINGLNEMVLEFPSGSIVESGNAGMTSGSIYDFSIVYDVESGEFTYTIGSAVISFIGDGLKSYQSMNIIANSLGGGTADLTEMVLNGEVITTEISIVTGGVMGFSIDNIPLLIASESWVLSGKIQLTFSADKPDVTFNLGNSVAVLPLADIELLSGNAESYLVSVDDIQTIEDLGAISVKLQETRTRNLNGFGSLLWTSTTINFISDFTALVFENDGLVDLNNLVYGLEAEQTSEIVSFGNCVDCVFQTFQVNDTTNLRSGHSVVSQDEESLLIVPSPLGYDVFVIF